MEDVPAEERQVNFNNNKTSKLSTKSFQLKKSKSKKKNGDADYEGEISLALGLEEGQRAIDLFFDNKFEESKEISKKQ